MSVNDNEDANAVRESFLRILAFDVIAAMKRQSIEDNQANRRELFRTIFVAIEGLIWSYREHILSVAETTGNLTPSEKIVLSEKAYAVTEQGKVVESSRFIALVPLVRLITRIAIKIAPALDEKFNNAGWGDFREALKIRHRLTHPKSRTDLLLDEKEMAICSRAFDWILNLCLTTMESATAVGRRYLAELVAVFEKLKQGDPATLAEYKAAAHLIDD